MEEEVANDLLDGAGTDVTTKVVSEQRRRRNNKRALRVIIVSLLAFCNCGLSAMYTIMQIHSVVGIQSVVRGQDVI